MRKEANQNFIDAFSTGSFGDTVECECGTIHFDVSGNWDDRETIERLSQCEEMSPTEYKSHDGVPTELLIDGKLYVYECQCGVARSIERLLNNDMERVVAYINKERERKQRHVDNIVIHDDS